MDPQRNGTRITPFSDAVAREWQAIKSRSFHPNEMGGLSSGFKELDEMTDGLHGGDLVFVASRPGMGTSAFMLAVVAHLAGVKKVPVGLVSLDMDREQLVRRMLAARSGVDLWKIGRGLLSSDDFAALEAAGEQMKEAPIFMETRTQMTKEQLRSTVLDVAEGSKARAIFVDGLWWSLCGEWRSAARELKFMAVELDIPVVCMAHCTPSQSNQMPRLRDLRVGDDADLVVLLHREELNHPGDEEWVCANPDVVGLCEIIVAKNCRGRLGSLRAHFDDKSGAIKPKK